MESNPKFQNLPLRTVSGIVLAAVALTAVYTGGAFFNLLIIAICVLAAFEWESLVRHAKGSVKHMVWKGVGCFYIVIPAISLMWIEQQPRGKVIIAWLMLTVWVSDSMAYFCGKLIGGPKIAKSISPNKTWAGVIGAVLAAYCVGLLSARYLFNANRQDAIITLTIVIFIYAMLGDLVESYIKRYFNVKDSGRIIPGHGGVLDRIDGMIFTSPKVAITVLLFQQIFS